MDSKYYLPKIKELNIFDYDLYKCPLNISFSSKLNIVFGTNGLGKTTLLNILQYSIIGPYNGKMTSRNYKDQQKLKRPVHDRYYFRNRMRNISENARVQVIYQLGNDIYEVWHSLHEHKLLMFRKNELQVAGEIITYDLYEKKYFNQKEEKLDDYLIDQYHRSIVASSCFPDINSYILMLTEVMFFSENRDFVFWDQDTCKLILSKFMTEEKYFEYDSIQKLVKKYDSQARLTSYKMSMVKDFLGEDALKESNNKTEEYTLDDLQKINSDIEQKKRRIEKYEKELTSVERNKTQNRIEIERVNRELTDVENTWYENIFPDNYQSSFNRFAPMILSGKCPFCGNEHIDKNIFVEECFYCGNKINTKNNVNLNELEIRRKNLYFERQRLNNNYNDIKKEISSIKKLLSDEQTELYELLDEQQKIKNSIDLRSNDNFIKYQQLELKRQEYNRLLSDAKDKERKLALEIDEYVKSVFLEYSKTFKKYAYAFLGADKSIELELVGDEENDKFLRFILDGSERESSDALSESQRIFVDMAYRLSTLDFYHNDSYYISETPDSTLDYFFEGNAVKTFCNFIDSGNTLFLSANARNSTLINSLVEKYEDDYKLVDLLKISNLSSITDDQMKKINFYKFLGE